MGEFTEHRKAEILSVLNKITEDDREKFNAYNDIHHALINACYCRIPEDQVLLEREGLVRFLKMKMVDNEVHGHVHECLIKVVENLQPTDSFPTTSHLYRSFDTPEEYNNALWGSHYLAKGIITERLHEEGTAPGKRSRKDKDYCGDKHKKTFALILV
jgi:hypothetical protein